MKHLKKPLMLSMLLTITIVSRTSAQQLAQQLFSFRVNESLEREREVMQDNEYASTGLEKGIFYCNPLVLDGRPLVYSEFNIQSTGELMVVKGAPVTGETILVPFYVSLRRNGNNVLFLGKLRSDQKIKVEISEILKYAKPGDLLVIEAAKKEDGHVKRILKLLAGGC
ncbi:MAG: hypothetical protein QM734_10060 [Cyclobacteriaceae bacterium]